MAEITLVYGEWEEDEAISRAGLKQQEPRIKRYYTDGPGDLEEWVYPKINVVRLGDEGGFGARYMDDGNF